jgi:serine-type D-Ala-D-Ala carboxypeptidase/endopeptidase (penicillin-binding protein 4)
MVKKILFLFIILIYNIYAVNKDDIKKRISNVLKEIPSNTTVAILIYDPLTQDTIFQKNHTISVVPASNTKLFTTATALSIMGGDYPLATKILCGDNNIKDGVINGNLYIKGYGNSVFTSEDLSEMVRDIKKLGIKKITGNIIGDDSYFDEIYTRADWINDEAPNIKLPPVSALVINRNRILTHRTVRYRRRGKIRRRVIYYHRNISNPPLYIARLLREKLQKEGIKVLKSARKGVTPSNSQVLAESKILLKDLVQRINKHSDNFLAECLFKTIGAVATGNQGNSFYSTQTILKFLKDNGIYAKGTAVVDGSGLSRYDLVTVGAIVGLLQKMYLDSKNFEDFYNSLSIAGVDGTLRDRMIGSSAENDFHGKTGTLNGVSSLSGYLKTARDEDLIVSIIFDFKRGRTHFYRKLENRIVEILTNW